MVYGAPKFHSPAPKDNEKILVAVANMKLKFSSILACLPVAIGLSCASCTDRHEDAPRPPATVADTPMPDLSGSSGNINENNPKLVALNENIKQNPKSVKAYMNRAEYLERAYEAERAIADYTYAIKLQPENPQAYLGRGRCYCFIERFGEGRADIQKATTFADANTAMAALKEKLDLDEKLHLYKDAIQDFEHLQKVDDNVKNRIIWSMPEVYVKGGEPEKAIELANAAIKRWPHSNQSWEARAKAYVAMGQKEKALADYTQAIARSQQNADLYRIKATLEDELGMKDGADRDRALANQFGNESVSNAPFRR